MVDVPTTRVGALQWLVALPLAVAHKIGGMVMSRPWCDAISTEHMCTVTGDNANGSFGNVKTKNGTQTRDPCNLWQYCD
ncbi:hypothetical protein SESBI_00821 [Sesbania bispinosa]|nr:hypothetical protein SESBI_00821 [Sesbania bispinosa]